MELKIYNKNNRLKATVSPSDSSSNSKEIMGDNVLSLSFVLYECIVLEVEDYVDFEGERFWITEEYTPQQKSESEWRYEAKLYGIESRMKRFLMLKAGNDDPDAVFSLTAPLIEHVRLAVKNINRGMESTDWKVGEIEATSNLTIDYNGVYVNEALRLMADAAEVEWWIDGKTVNLSRCEWGDYVALGYGNGLLSIDKDNNDNAKFFTRLFPLGSTRNIQKDKYGYSRLQLPSKGKYVEQNIQYGVIEHFEEDYFSSIYPRRIGVVTSTRTATRTGEDGKEFTIYYFKDTSLTFNPNDYEIAGLVKNIVFQSGELNGRDFEVNYDAVAKEFEIITQFPYDDSQLPGDHLIPEIGDEYILYNITMPKEYYSLAEQEFAAKVNEFLEKNKPDKAIYKAPTDFVDLQKRGLVLEIGRKVRIESSKFFPKTGYRNSRITKISRKVNTPLSMDIEMGETLWQGRMDVIQNNIEEVKNYAISSSGNCPDIIKSWENTPASDGTVYSSRRTIKEIVERGLSRVNSDEARGFIRFLAGLESEDEVYLRKGAQFGRFTPGTIGAGGAVTIDENGNSWAEFDYVTARKKAIFKELEVQQSRHIGGEQIVSCASMVCSKVDDQDGVYRCYFEKEDAEGKRIYNQFALDDQARCQTFNLASSDGEVSNHYYWRLVVGIGENYIDLSKSDYDAGSDTPLSGDHIIQLGNRSDKTRQSAQVISAYGVDAPSYKQYSGISSYSLEGCYDTGFTGKGNKIKGDLYLETGESIITKFQVLENSFSSEIEEIRQDMAEKASCLSNPYFSDGMNGWETDNDVSFFLIGGKWMFANDKPLANKRAYAGVISDGLKSVLYIRNRYVMQRNAEFKSHPVFDDADALGKYRPKVFYVQFYYKVVKPGVMTVSFDNVDNTDFQEYELFHDEREVDVTDGYQTFEASGMWNGTGDFKISFTGEIFLFSVSLSEDRLSDLDQRYATLFNQTSEALELQAKTISSMGEKIGKIEVSAGKIEMLGLEFDEDGNLLKAAGLITTAQANNLYAFDADGNVVSMISQTPTEIKLKASQISMEGLVTANENFKILEDGSIEANKGTFSGYIKTSLVHITDSDAEYGQWTISDKAGKSSTVTGYKLASQLNVDATGSLMDYSGKIILPNDVKYVGMRITIANSQFPPYTRTTIGCSTTVFPEGNARLCVPVGPEVTEGGTFIQSVNYIGGVLDLVCLGGYDSVVWVILNKEIINRIEYW